MQSVYLRRHLAVVYISATFHAVCHTDKIHTFPLLMDEYLLMLTLHELMHLKLNLREYDT